MDSAYPSHDLNLPIMEALAMHTNRQRPIFLVFAAFALLVTGISAIASPALAQGATATIEMAIYACPPEMDAYTASPDELLAACFFGEDFPPLSFTLDLPDGSVTGTESSAALATFTDVPVGDQVTLSEILPEGLGEPVVACTATNDADGAVVLDPTLVPVVNGNATEVEPEAGQTLSCNWYNVFGTAGAGQPGEDTTVAEEPATPSAAGASVEIVIHGCPDDFDVAATAAAFREACQGHPVVLLSAGDFADYYEANTTSGTAGDNLVQFGGVPATEITLSQLRPQSAKTLTVFCADASTADDPATWEQANVANGVSIDREIVADDQLTCHWFNNGGDVEGDASGSTVEIRAWTCVPGTEPGSDEWSDYFGQCDTADLETTFTLTDDAGAQPAELAGDWRGKQRAHDHRNRPGRIRGVGRRLRRLRGKRRRHRMAGCRKRRVCCRLRGRGQPDHVLRLVQYLHSLTLSWSAAHHPAPRHVAQRRSLAVHVRAHQLGERLAPTRNARSTRGILLLDVANGEHGAGHLALRHGQQAPSLGLLRLVPEPRHPARQSQQVRGHRDPLDHPSLVIGLARPSRPIEHNRDRQRHIGHPTDRYPQVRNSSQLRPVRNHYKMPRLGVAGATGPPRHIEQRRNHLVRHGFVAISPHLSHLRELLDCLGKGTICRGHWGSPGGWR